MNVEVNLHEPGVRPPTWKYVSRQPEASAGTGLRHPCVREVWPGACQGRVSPNAGPGGLDWPPPEDTRTLDQDKAHLSEDTRVTRALQGYRVTTTTRGIRGRQRPAGCVPPLRLRLVLGDTLRVSAEQSFLGSWGWEDDIWKSQPGRRVSRHGDKGLPFWCQILSTFSTGWPALHQG